MLTLLSSSTFALTCGMFFSAVIIYYVVGRNDDDDDDDDDDVFTQWIVLSLHTVIRSLLIILMLFHQTVIISLSCLSVCLFVCLSGQILLPCHDI